MAQYYMLNKPRGLLTARRDARCETVMRCFPEALQQTLHPVGRLDKDTEGLLLFTDDGMLVWGDRIFEKCGIGRDEGGDGGKTLEIRGKRRLSARDRGANYQQS